MAKYLFIESRDPFEFVNVKQTWSLAQTLAQKGNDVSMFLVQNGVLAARKNAHCEPVNEKSVKIFVDDFSLEERAIDKDELRAGIEVATIDQLTDFIMENGCTPIWN